MSFYVTPKLITSDAHVFHIFFKLYIAHKFRMIYYDAEVCCRRAMVQATASVVRLVRLTLYSAKVITVPHLII